MIEVRDQDGKVTGYLKDGLDEEDKKRIHEAADLIGQLNETWRELHYLFKSDNTLKEKFLYWVNKLNLHYDENYDFNTRSLVDDFKIYIRDFDYFIKMYNLTDAPVLTIEELEDFKTYIVQLDNLFDKEYGRLYG
jgi:nicotinic acid phosphoribosyltransferase